MRTKVWRTPAPPSPRSLLPRLAEPQRQLPPKDSILMSNDRPEALVDESSFAFCSGKLAKTLDRRSFVIASAGGIAASMLAPSPASAALSPVINQSGSAAINSGLSCTWITASGRNSAIYISNASTTNILKIAITGAPGSGITVQVNGQIQSSLNNIFTLPANSANYIINATGNFGGATLTVTNITNKLSDATAIIQCAT